MGSKAYTGKDVNLEEHLFFNIVTLYYKIQLVVLMHI